MGQAKIKTETESIGISKVLDLQLIVNPNPDIVKKVRKLTRAATAPTGCRYCELRDELNYML